MLEYQEPQPTKEYAKTRVENVVGLNKIHVGTIEGSDFGSMILPTGWSASVGGGDVTISHTIGHTNYVFLATVHGASRATIQYYHASGMSSAKTASTIVLRCFAVSGSNVNVDFDFVVIEYAKPN